MTQLLSPNQTAQLLGVSRGTLAVWRCTKRYPLKFVRIGTKIMYREEDVREFVESRTLPPPVGPRRSRK